MQSIMVGTIDNIYKTINSVTKKKAGCNAQHKSYESETRASFPSALLEIYFESYMQRMPLEQRDAVHLIAVTSIDFNVSYEPYAGRSNCKTPSVRKTTKREHWKCAKSFQPDWNTCVLWEGDLNDRSDESGIAGDHAYPNACEKKHASHHVLRTWRAEKPSNGTLEVPVTNWTSCEEAHYNRKNPQTNLIRTKNKENAWNNTQLWSRPQGVNPYFGCVLIAHFCYTAPKPLNLRRISSVSSTIPECGSILSSACTGHMMRWSSAMKCLLSVGAQVFTIYIRKSTPASKCYATELAVYFRDIWVREG